MMCLLVFTCSLVHICSYMVCLYTSYLGCNSNIPRVYQHYVSSSRAAETSLGAQGEKRWHTECTNFSATPTACMDPCFVSCKPLSSSPSHFGRYCDRLQSRRRRAWGQPLSCFTLVWVWQGRMQCDASLQIWYLSVPGRPQINYRIAL